MKAPSEGQYRAGDVVILQAVPARPDRPYEASTKIGRIRAMLPDGRVRVALRVGNVPMRLTGCRFAHTSRVLELAQVVRLATRREITLGAISIVLPMAVTA